EVRHERHGSEAPGPGADPGRGRAATAQARAGRRLDAGLPAAARGADADQITSAFGFRGSPRAASRTPARGFGTLAPSMPPQSPCPVSTGCYSSVLASTMGTFMTRQALLLAG